jgi:hypothetical protein
MMRTILIAAALLAVASPAEPARGLRYRERPAEEIQQTFQDGRNPISDPCGTTRWSWIIRTGRLRP